MIFVYLQRSVVATKENIFHFKSIVSKVHYLERDGFFYFMETEIWKDIIGFEGLYQVSSLGRIKSLSRVVPRRNNNVIENILKQSTTKDGYHFISLCNNAKCCTKRVHRLVSEAFIPKINDYQITVNHINGIKTDNRLDNLEWVSVRENTSHMFFHKNKNMKCIGVRQCTRGSKMWECRTSLDRKPIHIGTFKTEQEAIDAKIKFENENGIKNKYLFKA